MRHRPVLTGAGPPFNSRHFHHDCPKGEQCTERTVRYQLPRLQDADPHPVWIWSAEPTFLGLASSLPFKLIFKKRSLRERNDVIVCLLFCQWGSSGFSLDCFASLAMTVRARHCEEPTGPARSGRPDDRLRNEAIQLRGANLITPPAAAELRTPHRALRADLSPQAGRGRSGTAVHPALEQPLSPIPTTCAAG